MDILQTHFTKPIEREYEGWIIDLIERYFQTINKQVRIFAVSPMLEPVFPADEFINFDHKVIGLQFKKPSLSRLRRGQTDYDYSNLYWDLTNPIAQFPLIQRTDEIYYCLPTFVNRNYKKVSLDHTLFWRPDDEADATLYWYDNERARGTNNTNIDSESLRWGQFMERVYSCNIGNLSTARQVTRDILRRVLLNDANIDAVEGLYALILEL